MFLQKNYINLTDSLLKLSLLLCTHCKETYDWSNISRGKNTPKRDERSNLIGYDKQRLQLINFFFFHILTYILLNEETKL